MSYPPRAEDVDSPLVDGGQAAKEGDDMSDEEFDQIRRYEDFSSVDWIQDSLHERNTRARFPSTPNALAAKLDDMDGVLGWAWRMLRNALEEGQSYVVLILVGIGIGFSAALISIMTSWLSDIKMGHCSTGWWLSQKFCCLELADEGTGCEEWHEWGSVQPLPWLMYMAFAALFAFSAAYIVRSFAPYAAGSGISEIKCIIGGFIIKGFLGLETLLIKSLTLPLAIGSGLSVGKEGPSVHVACCVGSVVGGLFNRYKGSQLRMRELLTAASAAGVAVAFGSPIGGVLFSIEEMNQTFSNRTMWRSFVCALVATFTLASMDPFRTGKLVLFQVSYDRDWHYFEIPAYIVLGIFGGCYGAFVTKFNLQVASFRRKHLAQHGVAEAVVLATLTALIGYLNRFLRIDMTESMEILFRECEGGGDREGLCQASSQWRMVNSLLLATIIRVGFIIVSYGSKVPAGIFVPSMATGATFGRMIGIIVKALHQAYPDAAVFATCQPDAPCITPGTYAFLGAAAALGGITNLTVTVVVIMFELTGALTYILPVMIVTLVTKAVSDQIGRGGIADQMIRFNGYPFLEKEDAQEGDQAFIEPIAHVMKKDLIVMPSTGVPLQEISEIVQSTTFQGFPVVRSSTDRAIVGFIRKNELRYALDKARRARNLSPTATCTFQAISDDATKANGLLAQPDIVLPGGVMPRQSPNLQGLNLHSAGQRFPEAGGDGRLVDRVDFGQYVDETPLTVSPKMPLEIVLQLFRRMGPRVILVSHEGQLVGLVTIKDVLRHEASQKHREAVSAIQATHAGGSGSGTGSVPGSPAGRASHRRGVSAASSTGWAESWSPVIDDRARGLENVLEGALGWAKVRGQGMMSDVYSRLRGGGPGAGVRGAEQGEGEREAYEFELAEDGHAGGAGEWGGREG